MPHRHRVPLAVFHFALAGIGKTGRFLDRQGIHVGAQHHGRALADPEQADNAGRANPCRHLITGGAKPVRLSASPALTVRDAYARPCTALQDRDQPIKIL